jgi:hypothetical protein
MKRFIKQRLREEIIDGQQMDEATQTICNKMTIDSYEEALRYVEAAMKGVDAATRTKIMQRIHVPLENLRQEQNKIDNEVKTAHMSGDSMVDEADTYWHQIQSTICEQGSDFQ